MAESTCSVGGCDRPRICRDLCQTHYQRWRTSGVIGGPIQSRINGTPEERFWPKVDKNGPVPPHVPDLGACWVFKAKARIKGYAQFRVDSRMMLAHRFAYELLIGPIPDGMQIDHRCHNQHPTCPGGEACLHRRCVNPAHMDLVTNDENQAHRVGMGYAKLCRAGLHEMTEANVRITQIGLRVCRTCSPDRRADLDEFCANGHERTPENVRWHGNNRKCRPCETDTQRRFRERRREAS